MRRYAIEYIGGPLDGRSSAPMTRAEAHFCDGIATSAHPEGEYVKEWQGERVLYRWRLVSPEQRDEFIAEAEQGEDDDYYDDPEGGD